MGIISIELILINLVFLCSVYYGGKKLIKFLKEWRLNRMLKKWESVSPSLRRWKDTVILHTTWRCNTIPSASPFALKLETYLRIAKIPYEIDTTPTDLIGPKEKTTWITYNGVHVADSHLAIQFLNKKLSVNLNKKANEPQVLIARACRVMLEERFFWGATHFRMNSLPYFSHLCKLYKLKHFLPFLVSKMTHRMEEQGIGKHTPEEIYQMTGEDLYTVSRLLGNQKYFGGEEPCEEDCAIFGMVAQAVWGLAGSQYERLVYGELNNLKDYCERIKTVYWPDWDRCIDWS